MTPHQFNELLTVIKTMSTLQLEEAIFDMKLFVSKSEYKIFFLLLEELA
jgi:hypothetical protein